jgi:hypothetical protein
LSVAAGVLFASAVAQGGDGDSEGTPSGGAPSPSSASSFSSSCLGSGEALTAATGVITDGSGPMGDYLANTNCTWIVRPSAAAFVAAPPAAGGGNPNTPGGDTSPPSAAAEISGITLVFEEFKTVFDDDFLFITDASGNYTGASSAAASAAAAAAAAPELALYSGMLPTPMAVRFDGVTALKLNFLTRGNNRDKGFTVKYIADGSCYNDCDGSRAAPAASGGGSGDWSGSTGGGVGGGSGGSGGGGGSGSGSEASAAGKGVCRAGLCVCDDGWTGADCSVRLEPLPADGEAVLGSVGVGQTRYYRITVPSSPPDLMLKVGWVGGWITQFVYLRKQGRCISSSSSFSASSSSFSFSSSSDCLPIVYPVRIALATSRWSSSFPTATATAPALCS